LSITSIHLLEFITMPASASNQQVPPDMSHYPPEVLQKYLAAVEQEKEKGEDSDEAMFSDTEEETDIDDEDAKPHDHDVDAMAAQMQTMHIEVPSDIHADDSGFSSEDEYIDDSLRHDLRIRRELILGRPPAELQDWKLTKIVDYYLAYIKQLEDSDTELKELLDQGASSSGTGLVKRAQVANDEDSDAELVKLKSRTRAEIQTIDRDQLVRDLVFLAQGLFKKEKRIKKIVAVQGMAIATPAR